MNVRIDNPMVMVSGNCRWRNCVYEQCPHRQIVTFTSYGEGRSVMGGEVHYCPRGTTMWLVSWPPA